MKLINRSLLFTLLALFSATSLAAQCENWEGSPNKDRAEAAHVSYRNFVRNVTDYSTLSDEDFQLALNNWETAYGLAPAADGGRATHYRDGREFMRALHTKETDATQKAAYATRMMELYNQELECYPDDRAFVLGRKGFDQFYMQGYSMDAIGTIEEAMAAGGNDTEYLIFVPLGELITYHFGAGELEAERARALYQTAIEIADYNIENNETYSSYYESGKANMVAKVKEVETDLFDCEYFKEQLLPQFEADPENLEVINAVYQRLIAQGCDESDPLVVQLKSNYDRIYATVQEEYEAQLRAENPAYDASKCEEEEDWDCALSRYQEAADAEDDVEKKGNYLYRIAALQMRNGQLASARASANRAAAARPGWGKPYILIGDIYSRMGRNCGDSWSQRLAVLAAREKYRYARSIDSGVSGDANTRIGRLNGSLPTAEEAFSRTLSAGDRVTVGCGINETVTLELGN